MFRVECRAVANDGLAARFSFFAAPRKPIRLGRRGIQEDWGFEHAEFLMWGSEWLGDQGCRLQGPAT